MNASSLDAAWRRTGWPRPARSVACLLAAGLFVASLAGAAPRVVEAFDEGAWRALQAGAKQPAALVFTTTDCVHCPAAIDALARAIGERRANASLMAVVMDVAPGEQDAALLADAHYRAVDRLWAFAGAAPQLRHAVDPRWRGVTPYIVFLVPAASPRMRAGPPTAQDIDAWLRGAAPSR